MDRYINDTLGYFLTMKFTISKNTSDVKTGSEI